MENLGYSPLKYKIIDVNLPPNVILNKINNDSNFPYIKSEEIKFNNNPINKINYENHDSENIMYIKKKKNKINTNKAKNISEKKNKTLNISRNNNIYSKKRLNDGLLYSSVTSGIDSSLSNTQKNNILGNIGFVDSNTNNNIENNNISNIYNIKTTNNKSTNILIKNIYSNDDYFRTNIKEGLLHLKDFEIYKSNKISQYDMDNERIKKIEKENKETTKPLSMFLLRSEKKNNNPNFTKSCENINRTKNYKSCDNTTEKMKIGRQLSVQLHRKNNCLGKISRLMNCFNGKRKYSDKIIIRGTRNEKGGVVDFLTASPKKNYKKNIYISNVENKSKNLYKHPKWKIIISAKIIQNWWRNKKIKYFNYLNKIRKIQKNYRNYIFNKYKIETIKYIGGIKEINKNKKLGILLLKKIIEVKLIYLFDYTLFKLKNALENELKDNIILLTYSFFIKSLIDYIKNIKRKISVSFFTKLKNNKYFQKNNLEIIKESNLFFKGEKKFLSTENKFKKKYDFDFNSNYYKLNFNYDTKKINKYSEEEILNIINKFYQILFKLIIDKIKKEADRRTIIKAFRNINNMKYPILFFSLLKIQKYSNIKYNVMNVCAILIQRNYRYFRDKKSQRYHFSY